MTWQPTHQVVADELGVTVATVSRIRTGDRLPSLELMDKIETLTDWGISDQIDARKTADLYAGQFNRALTRWWQQRQSSTAATNGK